MCMNEIFRGRLCDLNIDCDLCLLKSHVQSREIQWMPMTGGGDQEWEWG